MNNYIRTGLYTLATLSVVATAEGCKKHWYNPITWGAEEQTATKNTADSAMVAPRVPTQREIDNAQINQINRLNAQDRAAQRGIARTYDLANKANTKANSAYGLADRVNTNLAAEARAALASNIANRRRTNAANVRIDSLAQSYQEGLRGVKATQDRQLELAQADSSDWRNFVEGRTAYIPPFRMEATPDSTQTDSTRQ